MQSIWFWKETLRLESRNMREAKSPPEYFKAMHEVEFAKEDDCEVGN